MKKLENILKQLHEIEEYQSIKYKLSEDQPIGERFENIRKYYNERKKLILDNYKKWCVDPYEMDWIKIYSPIERIFWNDIRRIGGVVLYPQYPVKKYFIDFANPMIKLGIEVDGKKWHDKEKDLIRDKELKEIGWTIYRVKGWECNNVIHLTEIENEYDYDYDYKEFLDKCEDKLKEYFCNTSEGFVRALRNYYFRPNYLNIYKRYIWKSIINHKSI